MKLTNGEIYGAREPMKKLGAEKFSVLVSLKLVKLAHQLEDLIKPIDEVRNRLIEQYGRPMKANPGSFACNAFLEKIDRKGEVVLDPNGNPLIEPNPQFPKFTEEHSALMAEPVEVKFEPVKLPLKVASTCDRCHHNMDKDFLIEPRDLAALEKFIAVEE